MGNSCNLLAGVLRDRDNRRQKWLAAMGDSVPFYSSRGSAVFMVARISCLMTTPSYRFVNDKGEHLHELDGEPLYGTSSVLSVIAKPLTWWASGLAVKEFGVPDPKVLTKLKNRKATKAEQETLLNALGLRLCEIQAMTPEAYLECVQRAYRAHQTTLSEKAGTGTDLHAELERFVKDEMSGQAPLFPYPDSIKPFIDWARENIAKYLWSEAHCFSREHWIGGISDLGFIDRNDKLWIMDFKSSKEAYLSQFWQCGGYAVQLQENGGFTADGQRLFDPIKVPDFLAVLPFGMAEPKPATNIDPNECMENFLHALALYKAMPRE